MDRKTFSNMLVKQRENANVGKNELCRLTGFVFSRLQRIEEAYNNYKISLVISYLRPLNCVICIYNDDINFIIRDKEDVISCIKEMRKNVFTQRKLANKIGVSYVGLANIERGNTECHIDILLKILDVLNYNIKIEKI